jgi:hypothetical protein
MRGRCKQEPNAPFRFLCGHECILPNVGISTSKVIWAKRTKNKNIRGGHWICKPCQTKAHHRCNRGLGPSGLLGRMRCLIRQSKYDAALRHHLPVDISPEDAVQSWIEQNNKCKACTRVFCNNAALDHDHKTGRFRGFIHSYCNRAEGLLKHLNDQELENFILYLKSIRSKMEESNEEADEESTPDVKG